MGLSPMVVKTNMHYAHTSFLSEHSEILWAKTAGYFHVEHIHDHPDIDVITETRWIKRLAGYIPRQDSAANCNDCVRQEEPPEIDLFASLGSLVSTIWSVTIPS